MDVTLNIIGGISNDVRRRIDSKFMSMDMRDATMYLGVVYEKLACVLQYELSERRLGVIRAISSIYGVVEDSSIVNAIVEKILIMLEGKEVITFDCFGEHRWRISCGIDIDEDLKKLVDSLIRENVKVGSYADWRNISIKDFEFSGESITIKEFKLSNLSICIKEWGTIRYNELTEKLRAINENDESEVVGDDW